jgi:hypothetical protein
MLDNSNDQSFSDYLNARPLDVHKWSDHSEVNEFVNETYKKSISIKGHEKTGKKLVKVLLLDLYVAWSADPELKIMFSRDNNAYKAKSRYNELHVGKAIIGIVDALVLQGIIKKKNGFNDRISGIGFQSRIWASEGLKAQFKKAKFHQFHIHSHENREPIVLRNKNKDNDKYQSNEKVRAMRSVLSDYNDILANTHIDIYNLEKPVIEIGEGKKMMRLQINQQDKFVRRIFNNSRWDQGGRFYGGWWQRCPTKYRESIMMDGMATSEIDFSGLHVVLLYSQVGINYWAEVNEDPYLLHGINNIDPEIDLRAAAKLLMLTAINADKEKIAFKAFRRQASVKSKMKSLGDDQLEAILAALKRKHEPIAHKIASGAGIDLMYLDSQITEKLVEAFTYTHKCPILTVHDSYVVPFGYDRILYKEMQKAFTAITGTTHPVAKHTTEYSDRLELESDGPEDMSPQYSEPASKRYIKELKLFREFKGKPEAEDWVPEWTMVY